MKLANELQSTDDYSLAPDGIWRAHVPVEHRSDEYDEANFSQVLKMQEEHFWYRGRHRFLVAALRRQIVSDPQARLAAIDIGGGCGGWIKYLHKNAGPRFSELAIGDSSPRALSLAKSEIGGFANLYHIDVLNLHWTNRWDVIFLLDVLEHIPDDAAVLRQIHAALRPGGLLFVTTPALRVFWSYNDDLVHHVRRYSRRDFRQLALRTNLDLVMSRYFMFFLSPLLVLSRLRKIDTGRMTADEIRRHRDKTHRVPAAPVNALLAGVFSLETPLGLGCPFPWGTSLLGVFRKPR